MDDLDILFMFIVGLCCCVLGLFLGVIFSEPIELENGCIVHNDKIYCEVNNGRD